MRMNTRERTGRTARFRVGVSVTCMALLLGGILPAGATEVASIPEAFHTNSILRPDTSCNGNPGWEIISTTIETSSNLFGFNYLEICGERRLIQPSDEYTPCWEGINGSGVIAGAEVFDLMDVTIKKAGTQAAEQAEALAPALEGIKYDVANLGSLAAGGQWLIEGRYVRRSDRSQGQLTMVGWTPAAWGCDLYSRNFIGSGVLMGDVG